MPVNTLSPDGLKVAWDNRRPSQYWRFGRDLGFFSQIDELFFYLDEVASEGHLVIVNTPEGKKANIYLKNTSISSLSIINSNIGDIFIENSTLEFINIFDSSIGSIKISDSSIPDIRLSKCKQKNIQILNSTLTNIYLEDNTGQDIFISNKSVIEQFAIGSSSNRNLLIDNSTTKNAIINNSSFNNIKILNKSESSVEIINSFTGDITAKNSLFEKLLIDLSTVRSLILNKSTSNDFLAQKSTLGEVSISKSKIGNLTFFGSRAQNKIAHKIFKIELLGSNDINQVEINDYFIENFIIKNGEIAPVKLTNVEIKEVSIENATILEPNQFNINNAKINRFLIENIINNGTLVLNSISPLSKWIGFEVLASNQRPKFSQAQLSKFYYNTRSSNSKIDILYSDLGKTHLLNSRLDDFHFFVFIDTKILNTFIANSAFPSEITKSDRNYSIAQQRLYQSQVKQIYNQQGDTPNSTRFLSKEMNSLFFEKLHLLNHSMSSPHRKFDIVNDILVLFFNRISTNHGSNAIQGIVSTSIITLLFFSLYCYALGYRFTYNPQQENIDQFFTLLSYAPQYLNPFRDSDSVIPSINDSNTPPLARILDYFSRIIVSYFVYQTIQAFRKLGKSSG